MSGRVVVVGSVNVDLIVSVPRLPGVGETVTGGTLHRAPGGKGANQAAAAAKLGANTSLVGLTGDDEFGRLAREDLASFGVDVGRLGYGDGPTGIAAVLVDDRGENLIAVVPGANHEVSGAHVSAELSRIAARGDVVLSVLELSDEAVESAAAVAHARGSVFILDPAPARTLSPHLLAACDILTPNEHEADALGGIDELLDAGVGAVVVTRGAAGADLHRRGQAPMQVDPFLVDVVDTTGAGDAFNGALAWALADGRTLEEAVHLATGAGALATRELGARAGLPYMDELERLVSDDTLH
jgi:ribokinase